MAEHLKFELNEGIYRDNIAKLSVLTVDLKKIERKAGTDNPHFKAAWSTLYNKLISNQFSSYIPENRFDLRALALALNADRELRQNIVVTVKLLEHVSLVAKKPSSLFTEALLQYFLINFDSIEDPNSIGHWLLKARESINNQSMHDKYLLRLSGPSWLAKTAIADEMTFDQQLIKSEINNFAQGDFAKRAKYIYYVEQLQSIPANEDHDLLHEISKPDVFNAKYDDNQLLGNIALKTLISRAPTNNVCASWQNVIIAIAGDPRIPVNHPRFIKWWSNLPSELVTKVKGWLSKFDLKLFLEALEDLSITARDEDMMRMFPSRKNFLEGLYEAGAILETKLYLSRYAEHYIKKNYKPEHRPEYSLVQDGDRSIIYARLTNGYMIEGSHNCQIWFYKKLPDSIPFIEYGAQKQTYRDLTSGFNARTIKHGYAAINNFTHHPVNFNWQRKALETLKRMGVSIRAADVLSADDYQLYKRLYGV